MSVCVSEKNIELFNNLEYDFLLLSERERENETKNVEQVVE